ncbi:MAG: hypothetical protein RL154_824 [Pseudomonadota bacterium]|jgi:CheY-like chemotaxis protein
MTTKILCVGPIKNIRAFHDAAAFCATILLVDTITDAIEIFEKHNPNFVVLDASICIKENIEKFKSATIFAAIDANLDEILRVSNLGITKIIDENSSVKVIAKSFGFDMYHKLEKVELEHSLKNLIILYVEDDHEIASVMLKSLNRYCNTVVLRQNGKDAVETYLQIKPDIIISDIQMPIMDGLAAAKIIRHLDYYIPIILTTAHSDERYFIDSIETKVDRYILKPIDMSKLIEAITDAAVLVKNRAISEGYKKRMAAKELKLISDELVREMVDVNPDPIFILHDGVIAYSNPAFDRMITGEMLKNLQNGTKSIEELFVKLDGYIKKCSDYPKLNKAAIRTLSGKQRLFNVSFSPIFTFMNGTMVILRDITLAEYRKNKYENATMILNNLVTKVSKNSQEPVDLPTFVANFQSGDKLCANDYADDCSISQEELNELKEYEEDIFDCLEFDAKSISYYKVGVLIDAYSRTLHKFIEFNEMSDAISGLATLLIELADLKLDAYEKLRFYVYNIVCDLSNWREHVFIVKDAIDIHYLDASLLSSCLQAKFTVTGFDDSTDDLELF